MKPYYLLVLAAFSLPPMVSAEDSAARANTVMESIYQKLGGAAQAREQLTPIAEKKLRLCGLCHGPDGNSSKSNLPSLAGERPEYLLQRWYQIVNDHGEESETERKMLRRIDEDQRVAMALYFSGIERVAADFDTLLATRGQQQFETRCQRCHQADGRGSAGMPVIAGQQPGYMTRTLLHFQDDKDWRHNTEMGTADRQLPPMQIRATANYATSLGVQN